MKDAILARLEKVKRPDKNGEYMALCPFHDDKNPSLSINFDKGTYHCFGCQSSGPLSRLEDRLGVNVAMRAERRGGGGTIPPKITATVQHLGCTLADYSTAKRLPIPFLQSLGLSDVNYLGAPAVRIPYRDATGAEMVRFRLNMAGDDRFRWRTGSKPMLYGLWRNERWDTLVEGETDTQTLWHHNIPALGLPGASSWREEWSHYFKDIDPINVVIEPDQGGEAMQRWITNSSMRDRIRLVTLGESKDVSDLYLRDPEHFREHWAEALARAKRWADCAAEQAEAIHLEAWAKCQELAREHSILDRFVQTIGRLGVVGEERTLKLLYLALVSRRLDRLVSIVLKGPSSGGKSFLVEQLLRFFPASAFYALSAMSERALAYSDEPLEHRFLVLYEASALQGDFLSYLVRSMLSEGHIRYWTVEKTANGLRPRLIERPGPTGLIVTTTGVRLHPENETRMLSVTVTDTTEQTQRILKALAARGSEDPDLEEWHALQTWLDGAESRVTIPYAEALASKVSPLAVRLRRDFRTLLDLIRSHAILHQVSRDRDEAGQIVATYDDYQAVYGLVADLFSEGVEATVSPTVRETVSAVAGILQQGAFEATIRQVMDRLKLDKGTVSRRCRVAIDLGYLKNVEQRRGHTSRLVLGDTLPDDQQILPTVETLKCCGVAVQTEGILPPLPPETVLELEVEECTPHTF